MARRRGLRRNTRRTLSGIGLLTLGAGAFYYGYFGGFFGGGNADESDALAMLPPRLTTDRPVEDDAAPNPYPEVAEKGAQTPSPPAPAQPSAETERSNKIIESARQLSQSGNPVAARQKLSEAMNLAADTPSPVGLRAELVRLGEETVFSSRIFPDDPLVTEVVVQPGDSLDKIGKAHDITAALIARINGISNPNLIRTGQRVKVLKGPLHAKVTKGAFRLDIYLQDTFVQSFPVGLGAEDSTPTGQWRITEKLPNPKYYAPRGGKNYEPDDPENPLGERWIGLEGVSGNAKGQMRYGIHGTIDPSSIGRSVSLGCIRLHNADVERVYEMLIPAKSTVEVVE